MAALAKNLVVLRDKLPIEDKKNHEKFLKKTNLFFSGRFRWNVFVFLLAIGLILMPIFVSTYVTLGLNCYFVLSWFLFLTFNTIGNFRIMHTLRQFADPEKCQTVRTKYKHIFVTFSYKEPLALLQLNLNKFLSINGSKDVILLICLEEKTPDLEMKIREIGLEFGDKFTKLFVTVHPFGVEGDIPGKCSNSNYGIRSLFKHLKEENPHLDTSDYILTNFDVDTVFHKNFLDILNLSILENEKDLAKIVFQPLLYYNWNLDKLSFFTRIIGVLRVNSIFFIKTTKNLFILYHGSIFNFQRAQ